MKLYISGIVSSGKTTLAKDFEKNRANFENLLHDYYDKLIIAKNDKTVENIIIGR